MERTQEYANQGVNPGGVYQAIWCRDASYILYDWFLNGNADGTLLHIYQIWSHQITPDREKIVFGRGSPDTSFSAEVANKDKEAEFDGALPTTIYQAGFSEVYGKNPDIDSTALMISTTSWILTNWYVVHGVEDSAGKPSSKSTVASVQSADYVATLLGKIGVSDPRSIARFVVPRMLKAVEYLSKRDTDNDGLLEQGHNEDWMDTAIRTGKIVYSQACWILALINFSLLLSRIRMSNEAAKLRELANKAIDAVDQKLWSEKDGCYLDLHDTSYNGEPYRILTQDVSFFLVAITQNTEKNSARIVAKKKGLVATKEGDDEGISVLNDRLQKRALSTLEAVKKRSWKEKWPLVTETELKATAPWQLKPYEYHNHTFWPWIAGMEMLARSRFNQVEECDILLSTIASEGRPQIRALYEWLNPITDEGHGAFPFRTGITTIRIALFAILIRIRNKFPQLFESYEMSL